MPNLLFICSLYSSTDMLIPCGVWVMDNFNSRKAKKLAHMWFYQIFHLYLFFNCSYCCRALEFAWSSTYSRVRTVANPSGLIDQNCSKAFLQRVPFCAAVRLRRGRGNVKSVINVILFAWGVNAAIGLCLRPSEGEGGRTPL